MGRWWSAALVGGLLAAAIGVGPTATALEDPTGREPIHPESKALRGWIIEVDYTMDQHDVVGEAYHTEHLEVQAVKGARSLDVYASSIAYDDVSNYLSGRTPERCYSDTDPGRLGTTRTVVSAQDAEARAFTYEADAGYLADLWGVTASRPSAVVVANEGGGTYRGDAYCNGLKVASDYPNGTPPYSFPVILDRPFDDLEGMPVGSVLTGEYSRTEAVEYSDSSTTTEESVTFRAEKIFASSVDSTITVVTNPSRVPVGSRATLSVTVTAPGTTPTGRVKVKLAGRPTESVRLNDDGEARLRLPVYRKPGLQRVKVIYDGDEDVEGSTTAASFRVVRR